MSDETRMELLRRVSQAGESANAKSEAIAMGLDRQQAEGLAVGLMNDGLLEMVSLSGSVRLTEAGKGLIAGAEAAATGTDDLPKLLEAIAKAGGLGLGQRDAGDLAADVACLMAHLQRSRPLDPVVRSCLAAIYGALDKAPEPAAAGLRVRINAFRKE